MTRSSPLARSVALPVILTAGLLVLALAGMLLITTRSLVRMKPMQDHLVVMQKMHDQILAMQQIALRGLDAKTPIRHGMLLELQQSMIRLAREPNLLTESGRREIVTAQDLLDDAEPSPGERLQQGITLLQAALVAENRAHATLLRRFRPRPD